MVKNLNQKKKNFEANRKKNSEETGKQKKKLIY